MPGNEYREAREVELIAISYVSLSTTYYMDPAVEALSPNAERLMTRALANCGLTQSGGYLTLTRAKSLGIPAVKRRIFELVSAGILIETDNPDTWRFVNWDKWQEPLNRLVKKRKSDRERVATKRGKGAESLQMSRDPIGEEKRREEERANALSIAPGATIEIPTEEALFDDWYSCYPRKVGRGAARKAFSKALNKVGYQELIESTIKYSQDPNLPPPNEKQFIPMPATWLNQERWLDEPLPPRNSRSLIRKTATERASEYLRTPNSLSPSMQNNSRPFNSFDGFEQFALH